MLQVKRILPGSKGKGLPYRTSKDPKFAAIGTANGYVVGQSHLAR